MQQSVGPPPPQQFMTPASAAPPPHFYAAQPVCDLCTCVVRLAWQIVMACACSSACSCSLLVVLARRVAGLLALAEAGAKAAIVQVYGMYSTPTGQGMVVYGGPGGVPMAVPPSHHEASMMQQAHPQQQQQQQQQGGGGVPPPHQQYAMSHDGYGNYVQGGCL